MKKIIISFASILTLLLVASAVFVVYVGNKPEKTMAPNALELLAIVNQERAKVGVAALTIDPNVQRAAQIKANDFSNRGYYSHVILGTTKKASPEMEKLLSSSCSYISENINNAVISSQGAVDSWLSSPAHKTAMLDPKYNKTGFGISLDKYNRYYTVQHFCIAK